MRFNDSSRLSKWVQRRVLNMSAKWRVKTRNQSVILTILELEIEITKMMFKCSKMCEFDIEIVCKLISLPNFSFFSKFKIHIANQRFFIQIKCTFGRKWPFWKAALCKSAFFGAVFAKISMANVNPRDISKNFETCSAKKW